MRKGIYMVLKDFGYDGEKLSDYGFMPCVINSDGAIDFGSTLKFNTVKTGCTGINRLVSSEYENVCTATFDVCKNPCKFENFGITDIELRQLSRWLNKRQYKKFKPVYENGEFDDMYFLGSFNLTPISVGTNIVGITLAFTSNAPYGYGETGTMEYTIENADGFFYFSDTSDEMGFNYPSTVKITCAASGDLKITNDADENHTVLIKNCKTNETITLDCVNEIITTNMSHAKLFNDFNYNYIRFYNEYDNTQNKFTVSLPCKISIDYSPIRKVGIIV